VVRQVRPPTPENESSSPTKEATSSSPPPRPPRPSQPAQPAQPTPSRQTHKKTKSKDGTTTKITYKPINFGKERPAILETIAAAQQNATNLSNALKRLNRETHHPEGDPQIQTLYRECRKLRKDILIYIQRTESEEWIGTLINANDELVQSLAQYEIALKPVEQDSDSDAVSVSDSEEEDKSPQKASAQERMPTGGLGRSPIAADLAQRLRSTSLGREGPPPPKPPRPVVEAPPAKPPRPSVQAPSNVHTELISYFHTRLIPYCNSADS
jgi:LAS seventeen-binding protein 5